MKNIPWQTCTNQVEWFVFLFLKKKFLVDCVETHLNVSYSCGQNQHKGKINSNPSRHFVWNRIFFVWRWGTYFQKTRVILNVWSFWLTPQPIRSLQILKKNVCPEGIEMNRKVLFLKIPHLYCLHQFLFNYELQSACLHVILCFLNQFIFLFCLIMFQLYLKLTIQLVFEPWYDLHLT